MHRLTLICHAASSRDAMAFPADAPLDERTRAAVPQLPEALRRADRALASPLLRARQTAQALGLAAAEDAGLRDLDLGRWTGRALAEIHAAEPEAAAVWLMDAATAPHGGESRLALQDRVAAWLEAQAALRGHSVCVTHAAVIRAAALGVLDAPADAFFRLEVAPLSLTELTHDGRRWSLRALNAPLPPCG